MLKLNELLKYLDQGFDEFIRNNNVACIHDDQTSFLYRNKILGLSERIETCEKRLGDFQGFVDEHVDGLTKFRTGLSTLNNVTLTP